MHGIIRILCILYRIYMGLDEFSCSIPAGSSCIYIDNGVCREANSYEAKQAVPGQIMQFEAPERVRSSHGSYCEYTELSFACKYRIH